jgi:hypothetical protein
MMTIGENLLIHYGWQGIALSAILLTLWCVQLYYYLFAYGRIPGYKNNLRKPILQSDPPLSVIIPMFSENTVFVEEQLVPLILSQEYHTFEVIVVYVGCDKDFFEDLQGLSKFYPRFIVTKIEQNLRLPISTKAALNVGIKAAHYEHLVFSTTEAYPLSNRWLALMAKGFTRGDIVVGYCGLKHEAGFANRWMRLDRMMESVEWLSSAIAKHPYRGIRHNFGFTKSLYFKVKGFNHLKMNIGEDDLFVQHILTNDNLSVVLSPRASVEQNTWGGLGWWISQRRLFSSTRKFYPSSAKVSADWESGSRLLFFLTAITALAVMPIEYKWTVIGLILIRYLVVFFTIWRITRRLGEKGLRFIYFLYDLFGPLYNICLRILCIRSDTRAWR